MNRIGTAILFALALVLPVAATAPGAQAGDGAAVHVLGFSADGRYFAFEQYGEQDGSGSLHSTITAIEIAGDRLVKGMPVAAIMDPDNPALGKEPRDKQLADIRAKAAADAAALLQQLGISGAGHMVASVRDSRARSILQPEQVKTAQKAVGHNDRTARRAFRRRHAAGAARVRHRAAALQGPGVRRASQRLRADARAQGPPDHPPEPRPDDPGLARLPGELRHRRSACATPCPTARPRSRS